MLQRRTYLKIKWFNTDVFTVGSSLSILANIILSIELFRAETKYIRRLLKSEILTTIGSYASGEF